MKNLKPILQRLLFILSTIWGIIYSQSAGAITKLEPKSIVIAVENSAYTQSHAHSIQRFTHRFLDSIPLGFDVALYEFGSQTRLRGRTNNLTRHDVIELKRRLLPSKSHDRFIDYKDLALNLHSYSFRPTSIIVITSGMSCLLQGEAFVDPIGPLLGIFPDGRGHMLLLCGATNTLKNFKNLPDHVFIHQIDQGLLPSFKKKLFFNRILLPNPTWTPSKYPISNPSPTSTPTPTFTSSPAPTRTPRATATPSPTPSSTPTPTSTHTSTSTPTTTDIPPIVVGGVDQGTTPQIDSHSLISRFRPFLISLLLVLLAALFAYKRLLNARIQAGALQENQEDSVLKFEMILNRKDGTDIDSREFTVDSPYEEILVGRSAKSNWFRPELSQDLKFKIFRDGRLQKWAGWHWQELFPGDQVALEGGLSLGWTFQRIPREELYPEGR